MEYSRKEDIMSIENLSKEIIKDALREVLVENPQLLKQVVLDIIKEQDNQESLDSFNDSLDHVFDLYGETLKKLA
ncbi:MAG: hypothetical protein AAF798_21520 [Bacteroidota bacterium]